VNILVVALILGFFGFIVQVIFWRIKRPKRHVRAILVIFCVVFLAGIVGNELVSVYMGQSNGGMQLSKEKFLMLVIVYVSGMLAYGITYTAIEADSPTMQILDEVAKAGDSGMHLGDLEARMTDEMLLYPRLADLVRDKMAVYDAGYYKITRKGHTLETIFRIQRNVFRLPKGG
jgi:hypothetical protein